MADFSLTERQREAVYTRDHNILVSAAAGSGKTSVLSRRIAGLVEEGADIRRMLVCTFTNPAASEMRERIWRNLEQRAEQTGLERLLTQAEYVQIADICTIHHFAIKVVRENYLSLGIPGDMRVGSEEEALVLRHQAMEQVFTERYEKDDQDFLCLRDRYSGRTDGELAELLFELFDFARSKPEGIAWLREASRTLDSQAFSEILYELIEGDLGRLCGLAERCRQIGLEHPEVSEQQRQNDEADEENVRRLALSFSRGEAAFEEELSRIGIPNMVRKGVSLEEVKKEMSDLKKRQRKLIEEIRELMPRRVLPVLQEEHRYIQELGSALYDVLVQFEEEYRNIKLQKKLLDFDDIISLAYGLLQNDDLAADYASRYDYIFMDEYQDTNPIQEALLARISGTNNRFMVGDMKQSIYRFRLADPVIFLEKTREFDLGGSNQKVIRMNDNFRSANGVIAPINEIMRRLMSEKLGELEYDEEEELKATTNEGGKVELLFTDFDGEFEENVDAVTREAHSVARKILSLVGQPLLDGREARFGDICVLMRKTKDNSAAFSRVFSEYGIPVLSAEGQYASMSEVDIFVNLLKIIDNRFSDVALLSVMRSHIGGFDERELAEIRCTDKRASIRSCLEQYRGEEALEQKCRRFESALARWQRLEQGLVLGDFLTLLKNETEYPVHMAILPGGEARVKHFLSFFDLCMGLADGQESLYSLLNYLEQVKRTRGAYVKVSGDEGDLDCVRIMSIHKSKGLEFPIVILARLNGQMKMQSLSGPVLMHSRLGIASDIIDEKSRTKAETYTKKLFRYVLQKELKSEELRILYVGMTRARERLVLSGIAREPQELVKKMSAPAQWYDLLGMSSMFEWILSSVLQLSCMRDWNPAAHVLGPEIGHELVASYAGAKREEGTKIDLKACLLEAAKEPMLPFLKYEACTVPAKIGVAALLPEFEDEVRPALRGHRRSGNMSAAEIGTAVHLLLQHLDFSVKTQEGLLAQIDQLEQREILSEEEAEEVRKLADKLTEFLTSELAYRIRRAKAVYREIPFCLSVPARDLGLADSGDGVVVQGIMDLVFEEPDGLVLVDYKSNMAAQADMGRIGARYETQIDLYRKALRMITGKPIKESYLYFLRAGGCLQLV